MFEQRIDIGFYSFSGIFRYF